jgi:Uma2 family endonuclease
VLMKFSPTLKGRYIEQMSDEEFFAFCQDNPELKFERNPDGEIIIMSPTNYLTGKRNNEILFQLTAWNKKEKLGECVDSDTGFLLSNNAMRNPDAAWISAERLRPFSNKELRSFLKVCPDFIVELKSETDSLSELKKKMDEWMANGCRLGWLIDADDEKVYLYEDKHRRIHETFDIPLSGEPVLPGFEFTLSELRI